MSVVEVEHIQDTTQVLIINNISITMSIILMLITIYGNMKRSTYI